MGADTLQKPAGGTLIWLSETFRCNWANLLGARGLPEPLNLKVLLSLQCHIHRLVRAAERLSSETWGWARRELDPPPRALVLICPPSLGGSSHHTFCLRGGGGG